MKSFIFLSISFLLIIGNSMAQERVTLSDSWTSVGFTIPLNDRWTVGLKEVLNMENDFYSDFNASFTDTNVKYKLNSNWTVNVLQRTWKRDQDRRNTFWFFFDLGYSSPIADSKWTFKNTYRMHYGIDQDDGEFQDGDFLRELIYMHYKHNDKWTTFYGIEPFFQFNKLNNLQRMRYEAGFNWKFTPQWNLNLRYRYQDFYNREVDLLTHTIVAYVIYNFKKKGS